jgi:hypothetical protein
LMRRQWSRKINIAHVQPQTALHDDAVSHVANEKVYRT